MHFANLTTACFIYFICLYVHLNPLEIHITHHLQEHLLSTIYRKSYILMKILIRLMKSMIRKMSWTQIMNSWHLIFLLRNLMHIYLVTYFITTTHNEKVLTRNVHYRIITKTIHYYLLMVVVASGFPLFVQRGIKLLMRALEKCISDLTTSLVDARNF